MPSAVESSGDSDVDVAPFDVATEPTRIKSNATRARRLGFRKWRRRIQRTVLLSTVKSRAAPRSFPNCQRVLGFVAELLGKCLGSRQGFT